jgi:hypothetical protein
VLNKLLSQWNQSISYGLPVGTSAIRLVAEVAINDVDHDGVSSTGLYVRQSRWLHLNVKRYSLLAQFALDTDLANSAGERGLWSRADTPGRHGRQPCPVAPRLTMHSDLSPPTQTPMTAT